MIQRAPIRDYPHMTWFRAVMALLWLCRCLRMYLTMDPVIWEGTVMVYSKSLRERPTRQGKMRRRKQVMTWIGEEAVTRGVQHERPLPLPRWSQVTELSDSHFT